MIEVMDMIHESFVEKFMGNSDMLVIRLFFC